MQLSKKAQDSAKGAAVLILLIAIFTVLYLLLLPPAEREAVLNQTVDEGDIDDAASEESSSAKTIMIENPGTVYKTEESKVIHDINSVNLFIKEQPVTTLLYDSFIISKSLFSEIFQDQTFTLEDINNLKNIVLYFTVKDADGKLEIRLNNNVVFLDEIPEVGIVKLIDLPINQIKEENKIKFSVSSPGIKFWSTNAYKLEDVGLKKTFEEVNPKEERTFTLSSEEKQYIETARLSYSLYCNSLEGEEYTEFKIFVNQKSMLSKTIHCIGGAESIEIPIEYMYEGKNTLLFMIEKGDFLISKIKVESQTKKETYPTYHFNLDSDEYEDITGDKKDLMLRLDLIGDSKKARIQINSKYINLDTTEDEYSKDISSFAEEGDNLIKLIPSETFTIEALKINLE